MTKSNKRKEIPSNSNGPNPKALKTNNGSRSRAPSSSSSGRGGNGNGGGDGPARIVDSVVPFKSKKDPNEYKVLLLSNGLRVCLVSRKRKSGFWRSLFDRLFKDYSYPVTEKMTYKFWNWFFTPSRNETHMALSVNIGGQDDPEDAQGLAHFTEHVVHFGSKKFSREDEYPELVSHLGTEYNAFTTHMTTCFSCDVFDSAVEKTLDVFSEMHTNPKMKLDLIRREVHSVDSEFYLVQPIVRKILLHLEVAGYQKGHPLRRLFIGKLETLGRGDARGSKLVQRRMRDNHRKNYVASAMALALNSTKSIEELEQLTLKHFSKLQKGQRQIQHETKVDQEWELPNQRHHIFLQGISSEAQLSLVWDLSSSLWWLENIYEMTFKVIMELLLTSSPKGLLVHLEHEGLIWDTYPKLVASSYAIVLELNFELTKKGRSRQGTHHILKAFDDYIRFLQGIGEADMSKYFEQMRILNQREFHYGFRDDSVSATETYAQRLQYVENFEEIVNYGSWENAKFNYARIMEALEEMREYNATVIETIPKDIPLEEKLKMFQPKPKIKEGVFKTAKYFVTPKQPLEYKRDFTKEFAFKSVSKYLDKELPSIQKEDEGGSAKVTSKWNLIPPENFENISPQILRYESREDRAICIPKISGYHKGHLEAQPLFGLVEIHFIAPAHRTTSPRGAALFTLWTLYIRQRLKRLDTEFSGNLVFVQIDEETGTLTLSIHGFPGNIEDISKRSMEHVFGSPDEEFPFNLAKEEMRQYLETVLGSRKLTRQLIYMLLFANKSDLTVDALGILEELTLSDLKCFIEAQRKCTRCRIELSGNVPVKLFDRLAEALNKIDFAPCLDIDPTFRNRILAPKPDLYKPGETCIRMKNHGNCTFTNYVTNLYILGRQKEECNHTCECFKSAMVFINQKAFNFLRTKKQLGYVVEAEPLFFHGLKGTFMGFYVAIIATAKNHTVCELDQNIDEFLSEYPTMLRNMPDDVYDKTRELKGIKVTKEETAQWYSSKFGPEFRRTDHHLKCLMRGIRKVSIQEIGKGNPMSQQKECNCQVCHGIQKWAKGRNHNSSLEFAVGNNEYHDYFVRDLK